MDADGNSEARIGWGSGFLLEDAPGGNLTELDEITGELPIGEDVADDVEVTHFKSPGKRKQYIAGLIDAGQGTLELNYIPNSPTEQIIRTAAQDRLTRAFRIVLPDEAGDPEWQIDGFLYVRSRPRVISIGGAMKLRVGVRFTGNQTEQAAA